MRAEPKDGNVVELRLDPNEEPPGPAGHPAPGGPAGAVQGQPRPWEPQGQQSGQWQPQQWDQPQEQWHPQSGQWPQGQQPGQEWRPPQGQQPPWQGPGPQAQWSQQQQQQPQPWQGPGPQGQAGTPQPWTGAPAQAQPTQAQPTMPQAAPTQQQPAPAAAQPATAPQAAAEAPGKQAPGKGKQDRAPRSAEAKKSLLDVIEEKMPEAFVNSPSVRDMLRYARQVAMTPFENGFVRRCMILWSYLAVAVAMVCDTTKWSFRGPLRAALMYLSLLAVGTLIGLVPVLGHLVPVPFDFLSWGWF